MYSSSSSPSSTIAIRHSSGCETLMSISLFMRDDSFLYAGGRPRRGPRLNLQDKPLLLMRAGQPPIAAHVSDPADASTAAIEAASRRKSDGAIECGAARR